MAERKSKVAETAEAASTTDDSAPARAAKSPDAAPLDAPQPKAQPEPAEPLVRPASVVAPSAPFAEDGTRLVDEYGDELALEDFLEWPEADAPRHEVEHPQISVTDPWRLVTVTKRVFREYTPLGARTKVTQLMYNVGARITKAEAERLRAESMPPPNGAGMWTGGPVAQMDPRMPLDPGMPQIDPKAS